MKTKLLVILFLLIELPAIATEISYSRSQSTSSIGNRIGIKHKLNQHRLGLSASNTKDTTNTLADSTSHNVKISYGYRTQGGALTTIDLRRTDEFYEFTAIGAGVKTSFTIFKYSPEEKKQQFNQQPNEPLSELQTKARFKIDTIEKTYSKTTSESFRTTTVSFGLEQDLTENLVVGVDVSSYNYQSTSTQLSQALNDKTVSDTNYSDILSSAVKSSASIFLDYSLGDLDLGISAGNDTPYFSNGTKTSSFEFSIEYAFNDQFSVNANTLTARSETSNSTTNTNGIGLIFKF